jgi:hypothetical protein
VLSSAARPIGGFLPLELPCAPRPDGILARWTEGGSWQGFGNARSAIDHALTASRASRLWLPSFFCPHTAAALAERVRLAFYSLADGLYRPPESLARMLEPGDAVLVVCYFGSPPGEGWFTLCSAHPDVVWIEDRAQALWPGAEPIAQWVVYSPRKVVGVPDGGVLVRRGASLAISATRMRREADFATSSILRFEDPAEAENERWYCAHREIEASQRVCDDAMSRLSTSILAATALDPLVARRIENHAFLRDHLIDVLAPIDGSGAGAPWFYATRTRDSDALAARLQQQRLFVSRLWRQLPARADCREAERIAKELVLRPCDHRYGAADLGRLVDAVRRALGRP